LCATENREESPLDGKRDSADIEGTLPISASGWCLLRAWSEKAEYPVMDNYAYATTGPIYVKRGRQETAVPRRRKVFAAWIQRTIEITEKYPDWNSPQEKGTVMQRLHEAQKDLYGDGVVAASKTRQSVRPRTARRHTASCSGLSADWE